MSRRARALPSPASDDTSVTQAAKASPAERWRALFGSEPPKAAGLAERAIAWREQVLASGDVAPAIARDLAVAARHAAEARACKADPGDVVTAPSAAACSISEPAQATSAAPCSISPAAPAAAALASPAPPPAAPRTRSHPVRAPAPLPPASAQLLPGTRLVKAHGGRTHVVEVTADGFLYEGAAFGSLSAIARHITGTHWNGLLFFGLRRRKTYPRSTAHG